MRYQGVNWPDEWPDMEVWGCPICRHVEQRLTDQDAPMCMMRGHLPGRMTPLVYKIDT